MCGRYALNTTTQAMKDRFGAAPGGPEIEPCFNLALGQMVPVILGGRPGERQISNMRWGLVPFWASEETGSRLANARVETVGYKPAFKYALTQRRCLIPATGFYSWKRVGDEKFPVYAAHQDGELFGFAGLWEEWRSPAGELLRSCAIITTEANRALAPVTRRMPIILRPRDEAAWLDNGQHRVHELLRLLRAQDNPHLVLHPVSQRVNSTRPNDERCIEPLEDDQRVMELIFGTDHETGMAQRPLRRHLVRDYVAPTGQIFFHTKSFSREGALRWHPVVDLEVGLVFCDCPDFRYRHAWSEPGIGSPEHWCKHVARAVRNCQRHGELPLAHLP